VFSVAYLIRVCTNSLDSMSSSGVLDGYQLSFLSVWTNKSRSLSLGGRSGVPFEIAICFPLVPASSSSLVGGGGRADGSCA